MPTTSTPSRLSLFSYRVKVEGEAGAVGTLSSTSKRYLAYSAALSEVPRAAIITDRRPPSRKMRAADSTSAHPSLRMRSRTSGCSRISAYILLSGMALPSPPVVHGLAGHDSLLYHALCTEDHEVGVGPRRYSSFFGQTQYSGRGFRSHPHGVLQWYAQKLYGVAHGLVDGQRTAGQRAVG